MPATTVPAPAPAPTPAKAPLPNPVIGDIKLKPGETSVLPKIEVPKTQKKDLSNYFMEPDKTPATKTPPKPQPKAPEPTPPEEPVTSPDEPDGTKTPTDNEDSSSVQNLSQESATDDSTEEAKGDLDSLLGESVKKPEVSKVEDAPSSVNAKFRKQYEAVKAERDKLAAEVQKFHVEQKDDLKEAFAQLQKERDDLAHRLEAADYASSPTYAERYVKPFEAVAASAIEIAGRYQNQTTGKNGTDRDVYALFNMFQSDPAAAEAAAEETFGVAGRTIIRKIETMSDKHREMNDAMSTWRKDSAARQAEQRLAMENHRKHAVELFQSQIQREKETHPELYTFDDPKLNDIYKRSESFADKAFSPDPNTPFDDVVKHQAQVRSLAAVAIPMYRRVQALEAELAQAKSVIAEYDGSSPKVKPTGEAFKSTEKKAGLSALGNYFKA